MFKIAGDAFFLGLLVKILSGKHNHPPYSGGVNSTHHRFEARKYQITKSQAFETNYYHYGHPVNYIAD